MFIYREALITTRTHHVQKYANTDGGRDILNVSIIIRLHDNATITANIKEH